jgi:hypothetical protein
VVAYCDRFDCFDTAFHGDGSGARQIAHSLVLGRIFNRTIGPARAPFSWRRKSSRSSKLKRDEVSMNRFGIPKLGRL